METKPILHYFTIRGRGEPVRLMLSFLKIDWDELVVPTGFLPEQRQAFMKVRENYEFRKVPVLEIDGHKLGETKAILRYLSSKNGMHPTDPYQAWKVDSLADHYSDMESQIIKAFFSQNQKETVQEFIENRLIWTLGSLEKRLKENSSQDFLVGDSVTIADVFWTNFYHSYLNVLKNEDLMKLIEEKFPVLNAFFLKGPERFPYLKTRPPSKY